MRIVEVSAENIREAAEVHAVAWRESHRDICSEAFVEAHTTGRQMQYILNEKEKGKRFYLLYDQIPLAIASLQRSVIADLYVHPLHQRQGMGTKLLQYMITLCDELPTLWVLNTNEAAQRFYQRNGFEATGCVKTLFETLCELEMRYQRGN